MKKSLLSLVMHSLARFGPLGLLLLALLLGPVGSWAQVTGTKTIGPVGNGYDYTTLGAALADVNTLGTTGNVVLELRAGYPSVAETFPLSYTLAAPGGTVTIRPATGANSLSISSSISGGPLFSVSAGKNLILDGRPGGSGTGFTDATASTDLTIATTNAGFSASTVAFSGGATTNTVQHCQMRGTSAGGGTVAFGSGANTGNVVQYNDIRESSAGTPQYGVTSNSVANASNSLLNNNVYNFFRGGGDFNAAGIFLSAAGDGWNISGNSFYQTTNRTGPGNALMYGINVAAGNNHTISGNFVGGQGPSCGAAGTPLTITGTAAAYKFIGILSGGSTTTPSSIQGNTIANISWLSSSSGTNTGGVLSGIYVLSGSANIGTLTGNNVGTLTLPITVVTVSGGTSYGVSTNTNGNGSTATLNIAQNTVQNISSNTSTIVKGIFSGNSATANISRNRVFNLAATSGVSSLCYGIDCQAVTSTITNNLIGDLKAPAANSSTDAVRGITLSTTSTASVYHNTVHLAAGGGATFGSSALTASTSVALDLRNNILVNTSTPGSSSGLTVAFRRSGAATTTNYLNTSNNNLLYGAGGATANKLLYSDGTALGTIQTLAAYKNLLTTVAGRDLYSVTELPTFQATTVATATDLPKFLHLSGTTQAEKGGQFLASVATDYDGDTRATDFPDIGADEGSFTQADLTQPYITFTAPGNGPVSTSRTLANVVIADPSGVGIDNSGLTVAGPYLYYRKGATGSYVQKAYTSVSGTGNSRIFTFTFDYTALTGGVVVAGDVIQYYIAAQDVAATANGGTFVPNVGAILTGINPPGAGFNTTPSSFTIVPTIPATVYVGVDPLIAGATFYTSITKAGGLFASLNAGFLNQNVIAYVNADLTLNGEDGSNALNAFQTDGNGTTNGSYTLTIQSNGPARTVVGSGVTTANGGLIRFNGAQNVNVNGGSGTARNLTFRTTTTSAVPVFSFYNDARYNTLNNLSIQSNNVAGPFGANPGTVAFYQGASSAGGNTNNLIDNCDIRNRSDIAAAIATNPGVAIYSGGSSTTGNNSNNTLRNSNVFDFANYGFYLGLAGGGDNWTIGGTNTGNNFYMTTPTTTSSVLPININAGANEVVTYNNLYTTGTMSANYKAIDVTGGNGLVISNNTIGGSQAGAGGNPLTANGTGLFAGIYLSAGSGSGASPYALVQNNVIKNIAQTNTSNGTVYGIYVLGGAVNVNNNTVGDANPTSPAVGFNSVSTTVGVYLGFSVAASLVNNNTVSGMSLVSGAAAGSFLSGISIQSGGMTVSSNAVSSLTVASGALATPTLQGIASGGSMASTLSGNTVSGLTVASGSGATPTLNGIVVTNSAASTVQNNIVKGLVIASGAGINGTLYGIANTSAGHQILSNTVGGTLSADGLLNASANNSGTVLTAAIQSAGANTGALVAGNTITNVGNTGTANSSSANINIVYGISAVNASGLTARNNRLLNIYSTASPNTFSTGASEGVQAMALRGTATNTNILNNQITLVGSGTAVIPVVGLSNAANNASATGNTFYFNSVYLSGTTGAGVKTYALRQQPATGTVITAANMLRLRNNILINERTGGTGNFAIGLATSQITTPTAATVGTTNAASVDSDYNDLYASESAAKQGENGTTAYAFGTVSPAAGWRGQAGNPDANSVNLKVKFVDLATGNLNLDATTNCSLNNVGLPIAGVNGEYDNAATSRQTTPDIGSDEFSYTPAGASFASTAPLCGSGTLNVTIGGSNGPFTIAYTLGGVAQTPITGAVTGQAIVIPNQTMTTNVVLTKVTDSFGCDLTLSNATVTVNPLPTASLSNSGPVCNGSGATAAVTLGGSTGPWNLSYTVNGGSAVSLTNQTSPVTITLAAPLSANQTVQLTALTDATTTCAATPATLTAATTTVTVNPLPTASLSNSGPVCNGSGATATVTLGGSAGLWNLSYTVNGGTAVNLTNQSSPVTITLAAPLTANQTVQLTALTDATTTCAATPATLTAATTTVVVNPRPTAAFNAPTTPVCAGSSQTLTGTLSGTAPFTGSYTVNGGTAQVLPITGSTFSIATGSLATTSTFAISALSDANCAATTLPAASTTVTVNPLPTAALSNTGPVCAGNTATATLTFTAGTGPFNFTYTTGGINAQTVTGAAGPTYALPAVSTTTTYALTALSDANCTATGTLPSTTVTVTNTTTYTGAAPGAGTDWFNPANWSACVPSSTIDATIPAGLANYPVLTAGTYEVRTLTLAASSSLSQSAGTLNVYGNLANDPAATLTLTGGMVGFLGATSTVASPVTFFNLTTNLSSAASTVTLSGSNTVSNSVTMTQGVLNTGGTLTLGSAATIAETDATYVLGRVSVTRTLAAVTGAESFGGIGLTLTPATGSVSPGLTPVVRTTGTVLTGVGTSVSIKRYFDIQPATNSGLDVVMNFAYLDHERNGIAAANVALFKSVSGTGGPWANQTPITIAGNTVSKSGITDFSVWTLGDRAAPLPVELTAFTAERQGSAAALAWTTASEKNSRGFEVQVGLDGRTFRALGFVASATPSSTAPRAYTFFDREAGKGSLRYYRLRQVDLDGSDSYSPVRSVRFDDAPPALRLTAAPNPFQQQLTLTVEVPTAAGAPAQLALTDAAGRTLLKRTTAALPAGSSQLELPGLGGLPSGVYFLHLALPGQPAQHLKVVKE